MRRQVVMNAVAKATLFLAVFALTALSGCKSTGEGTGESTPASAVAGIKARFTWEQSEPTSGTMKATVTMPDGTEDTYEGKFYQITKQSRVDTIGPLWDPWYPGWYGWPYWGPAPSDAFIEHYTGHVVANLADPSGQRMR
jgi:hypothetical protein